MWGATPGPLPRRPDGGRWVDSARRRRDALSARGIAASTQQLEVFVAPDDPVKVAMLTLTNTSARARRLSVFGYVEWCLGPPRAGERRFVVTERDEATGALLARNAYNPEFAEPRRASGTPPSRRARTRATAASSSDAIARSAAPAALFRDRRWRAAPARDSIRAAPCSVALEIEPGQSRRVAFVLGQGRDEAHARELARSAMHRSTACEAALASRGARVGRDARRRFRSERRTTRSI